MMPFALLHRTAPSRRSSRTLLRSFEALCARWAGMDGPHGAAPYPMLQGEWDDLCRERREDVARTG